MIQSQSSKRRRKPDTPPGNEESGEQVFPTAGIQKTQNSIPNKQSFFLSITNDNKGETLAAISPFAINRAVVTAINGEPLSLKKTKLGTVVVEVTYPDVPKLKALQSLGEGTKVVVSDHPTLNHVRGVVRSWHLKGLSDEEILEELGSAGVVAVKRLPKGGSDSSRPPSFILTFDTPTLPDTITILYEVHKVYLYYLQPKRCYNCQGYNHMRPCSKPPVCPRCAGNHELAIGTTCDQPAKCVNCQGAHDVRDSACPVYRQKVNALRNNTRAKAAANQSATRSQGEGPAVPPSQQNFPPLVNYQQSAKTIPIGTPKVPATTWPRPVKPPTQQKTLHGERKNNCDKCDNLSHSFLQLSAQMNQLVSMMSAILTALASQGMLPAALTAAVCPPDNDYSVTEANAAPTAPPTLPPVTLKLTQKNNEWHSVPSRNVKKNIPTNGVQCTDGLTQNKSSKNAGSSQLPRDRGASPPDPSSVVTTKRYDTLIIRNEGTVTGDEMDDEPCDDF